MEPDREGGGGGTGKDRGDTVKRDERKERSNTSLNPQETASHTIAHTACECVCVHGSTVGRRGHTHTRDTCM